MRLLVTGGAGYLGSTLVPLLLRGGHQVCVLDSLLYGGQSLLPVWHDPGFTFFRGDVTDGDAVERCLRDTEGVVHLAAIVGDPACTVAPDTARAVNLDASLGLIDACGRASVDRLVFASTCSNYGRMQDTSRYADESSELRPLSLYAETKVAVEEAILDSPERNGLNATVLRFATLFGVSPRMRFDLTVNEFTMEMLVRQNLVVYGEQFWRPYVHVRDAAAAIASVLESPVERVGCEVFNVGDTDENYQKQQLVEMIQPYAPDAEVDYVHKEEDPRDYRVSFAKVARELGFNARSTVGDGVREIVDLYRSGIISDYRASCYRNTP